MSHLETSFTQTLNAGHSQDSGSPDNLVPSLDLECTLYPWGTWASASYTPSPLSAVHSVHVVCNAPLFAPIPLPYHPPTFLQFELPDVDQDLSHPPYIHRSPKRKRCLHEDKNELAVSKRRSVTSSCRQPVRRTPRYNSHHPITPITPPRLRCYM